MNKEALLAAINEVRFEFGQEPVSMNRQLTSSAIQKAEHMCRHDYWSHDLPGGESWTSFIDQSGYQHKWIGENLAYGYKTPTAVTNAWELSPTHLAVMTDSRYTEAGIGVYTCKDFLDYGEQTIVVSHFGQPLPTTIAQSPTGGWVAPVILSLVILVASLIIAKLAPRRRSKNTY